MKTQVTEFIKDPESLRLYEQERIILDVTERICEVMEEKNTNRVQLAKSLGKTKGFVSQLLNGSANMTLRTMSDVFVALGLRGCVQTEPLYPLPESRFTFIHDDDEGIISWRNRCWEQEVAHYSPPPAPNSINQCESEVLAA